MTVDSAVLCARVGSNVPMSAEPARKKVRLYTCEPARSPGPVGVDEPQPAEASRAIKPSSTASVGSDSLRIPNRMWFLPWCELVISGALLLGAEKLMRYYKGEQAVILSIRAVLFKRCSDGACLPIGAGRDAQIAFEDAREVALVGKATLSANTRHGHPGPGPPPLPPLLSPPPHKLVPR